MQVMQLSWEYPPRLFGGLGRHVHHLSMELAALGVDVTVVTPALEGAQAERAAATGPRVLRAAMPEQLPAEQWIAAVLDANAAMADRALHAATTDGRVPDVVHVHDWMTADAGRLLAATWRVPLIATVHATERGRHQGHLPPGISPWIDARERRLVAEAARVIVCAGHMKDHLTAYLGADAELVDAIPNGVDVACWATRGPSGRAGTTTDHHVVYAGRLEYEKGVQVLLDAVALMAANGATRLTVAGDGTYALSLREQALAGRMSRVRFLGRVGQPRLAELLRSATVVVVPSLYEPFGLSALEAMAAGVPVIASRTGGLVEIVGSDAGVLVPPGDTVALSLALRGLLENAETRAGLVAAGRQRARELSWTQNATRTVDVYRQVMQVQTSGVTGRQRPEASG